MISAENKDSDCIERTEEKHRTYESFSREEFKEHLRQNALEPNFETPKTFCWNRKNLEKLPVLYVLPRGTEEFLPKVECEKFQKLNLKEIVGKIINSRKHGDSDSSPSATDNLPELVSSKRLCRFGESTSV